MVKKELKLVIFNLARQSTLMALGGDNLIKDRISRWSECIEEVH